jgi:hypothetical protein
MYSVAKCANPQCSAKFHRLGEGKLYVRPLQRASADRPAQKAAWLCNECSEEFDLRFDRRTEAFSLTHRRHVA